MTRKTYHHTQCHYPLAKYLILCPERATKSPLIQRSQKILQALLTLELRAGISQEAEEMVRDRTIPKRVSYHPPQVIQLHTSALITASSSSPSSTTLFSLKSSTTILICCFAVLLPLHFIYATIVYVHNIHHPHQVKSPFILQTFALFIYLFICLLYLFNYPFI